MDRITKALELARQQQPAHRLDRVEHAEKEINRTPTKKVQVSLETLRENRIISGVPNGPVADAYRLLRTRILRRMQQNNWKTLGVTSAGSGEGKTLTAINLGITIAMEPNHSVLLIDADLRRPNVHKYFGIKPELGLDNHLTSEVVIEDLLINLGIDRFVILPCLGPMKGSSELLATPKMARLIQELRTRYSSHLVIFNLPPVLIGDEVAVLSPHLDTILLVVEDGKTLSNELARAVELLEDLDLNIVGTVLNKSSETAHPYEY